jgi:hypothetical protein
LSPQVTDEKAFPAGKRCTSKVDDKKWLLNSGANTQQHRYKKSTTIIIAHFADMGG